MAISECEKLNVAALGNQVAPLRVHFVGRRHSNAACPKPAWGAVPPAAYIAALREGFIAALRRALQIAPMAD